MRVYLGCVSAMKGRGLTAKPFLLFARKEDEARGKAQRDAKKSFPRGDGWYDLVITVNKVSDDDLMSIVDVCREQGLIE